MASSKTEWKSETGRYVTYDEVPTYAGRLQEGDHADVRLVIQDGYWSVPNGPALFRADSITREFRRSIKVYRAQPPEVTFEPGDVVAVEFSDGRQFTYVRGSRQFLGETRNVPDFEIAGLFRDGKARIIARKNAPVAAPIDRNNVHLLTGSTPF